MAVLYILIHIVFLSSTPMSLMANQLEIGFVVSEHVFGEGAAKIFSALLAVLPSFYRQCDATDWSSHSLRHWSRLSPFPLAWSRE